MGPKTKSKRAGKYPIFLSYFLLVEFFPPVLTLSSAPLTASGSPRMSLFLTVVALLVCLQSFFFNLSPY